MPDFRLHSVARGCCCLICLAAACGSLCSWRELRGKHSLNSPGAHKIRNKAASRAEPALAPPGSAVQPEHWGANLQKAHHNASRWFTRVIPCSRLSLQTGPDGLRLQQLLSSAHMWCKGGVLRRPNIAVARVEVTDGRVVLVNSDRAVSTHRWMSPRDAGDSSALPRICSHLHHE